MGFKGVKIIQACFRDGTITFEYESQAKLLIKKCLAYFGSDQRAGIFFFLYFFFFCKRILRWSVGLQGLLISSLCFFFL